MSALLIQCKSLPNNIYWILYQSPLNRIVFWLQPMIVCLHTSLSPIHTILFAISNAICFARLFISVGPTKSFFEIMVWCNRQYRAFLSLSIPFWRQSNKINESFTENRPAAFEHILKQTALAVVNLTFLIRSCLIIAFLILLSTHLLGPIARAARISMTKQINSLLQVIF